jgi:hypothetical protein
VGAGLPAGDGSLAVGGNTGGRTEAGPVAGGLGGSDGDQYGGGDDRSRATLTRRASRADLSRTRER